MKTAAQTPVLAVSEVLGDQLQAQFEVLARALPQHIGRLERRFVERLRRLGYNPRERKALASMTPGAAAGVLASRRLPPDFIEQVEYNGRRLAKLDLAPARIVQAFREYDCLLAAATRGQGEAEQADLQRALERWYFCVVLTLNNAFHQVSEAETQTCQELFRNELESAGLDELLLRLLESLVRMCQAEAGAVFLREQKTGRWVRHALLSGGTKCAARRCRVTVRAGEGTRLATPRCSIRRNGKLALALDPAWRSRYRTCWSVPLASHGEVSGVLQFAFSKPYEWLPREVEVLLAAAERCLLAADKARLVEDLAAREAQVLELAGHLVQVEERERRRISAELHDEAGQSLLCVRLQLEMLEHALPPAFVHIRSGLAEAREVTERTIVEIRRLISALSPVVLDQLGLAPALRQLISRLRRLHKMQIRLQAGSLPDVPKPVAIASYRLAQECLNNAVRHSAAANVNISVSSADGELRLYVEDDGTGFRVEEALLKSGSFGLAGMRERVALLGGEFVVTSRPGRGTKVSIRLPIRDIKGSQTREVE